ncbi:MAG: hypothetical protein HQ522_21845 [Bacteroidetes bacterium]|nr:hypothetical protein [Bacteroidota bacterium]
MKIKFKTYLLFSLFWVFITSAETKFSHLTIEDGLSQSSVKCIFQDSKGFLWFGTADGLNKYDGYQFSTFNNNPNDPHSISGNDVSCVYENPNDSVLWVGTQDGGLNVFDRKLNKFVSFKVGSGIGKSILSNNIRHLLVTDDQKLWIASYGGGIFYFSKSDSTFVQPDFSKQARFRDVNCIERDDSGNLWIGATTGLYKWSPEDQENNVTPTKIDLLSNKNSINIRVLKFDFKGNLWVGTQNNGLFKYQPISFKLKNYTFSTLSNSISSNTVRTILQARDGIIWIGTMDGLFKYQPEANTFEVLKSERNNPESLNNNVIYSLFEDYSGIIWVGTYLGGINKLDPIQSRFPKFNNFSPPGDNQDSYNIVRSICTDNKETIWIGTSKGLIEVNQNNINSTLKQSKLYFNNVEVGGLLFTDQGLFAGTDKGLFLRKGQGQFINLSPRILQQTGFNIQRFSSAIIDDNKNIWFTNPTGLFKYNPEQDEFRVYNPKGPDGEEIQHHGIGLFEDFSGKIWIGTFNGRLYTFDKHTEEFELIIPGSNNNLISFNKIF